ncbi:hypothetical protein L0222_22820 [bacterium]|nr:hypothetical protein [bacterium]MCI0606988.1 hypothetical protein [bacterium]
MKKNGRSNDPNVKTKDTAPTPSKETGFETGEPVKDLGIIFKWQTNKWRDIFDKQVELIQSDIRRAIVDDRQVVYLSCPISSRSGSFYPANVEIANYTQQRLLMTWGTAFWILNPAQYQMESKEGTGLIDQHAKNLKITPEELKTLKEKFPPTGGDYMRMWTKVLVEDVHARPDDSKRPPDIGDCFSAYYFIGPTDVRDFFTKEGTISLTAGVEEYLARKINADPVFHEHFTYPLKDERDPTKQIPDEQQAEEWERRRKDFFRYYTIRASINFSKGSHDEWEILRLVNNKRMAKLPEEFGSLTVGYFDGRQIAPGAVEAKISKGYAI